MEGNAPAPVIVVGSQKGGIGRTTLAVNLAAMLALSGRRTLLVDLDAKGDATAALGLPRASGRKSVSRLSEPWSFLKDTLTVSRPAGLDVWPGGPALKKLRNDLNQNSATNLLERGLSLARQRYRAVIIDAPPDLGPLANNAMACGDFLLLPITDQAFAEHALEETITAACRLQGEVSVFGIRLETAVTDPSDDPPESLEGPLGLEMLDGSVCYDAATFNQAATAGLPVFEVAPGSRAARCFLELGREVVRRFLDPSDLPTSPASPAPSR